MGEASVWGKKPNAVIAVLKRRIHARLLTHFLRSLQPTKRTQDILCLGCSLARCFLWLLNTLIFTHDVWFAVKQSMIAASEQMQRQIHFSCGKE
ncbi:hypothetical protein CDAR_90861 [Caerostris darwini]|uniref:Uncharacterized protein n=1 Tax=Caerostris darwini TaxID=1538125 RepID=A0AAV4QB59_9ARAC|nr:hypothetical protein CDAR_90861 [Caerostris darwini]